PWQIFFLLLFCAEEQQWLRNADRLMRRNERSEICIPTAEQHRRAPVIHLRQTEPAVLLRNFHAKGTHREKIVDVLLRNFAGAIDLVGVDIFAEIFFQAAEEFLPRGAVFSALLRIRMDAREIVAADEKIAGET